MNRQDRRAEKRTALRHLRARGCRCCPTIDLMTPEQVKAGPPGALAGGFILHQKGCPLGDAVRRLNDAGYFPAVITYGCGR